MHNIYHKAIMVQDASNLAGVSKSFAEVVQQVLDETGSMSEVVKHPAVILFADKISQMCSVGAFTYGLEIYSNAYRICKEKAGEGND